MVSDWESCCEFEYIHKRAQMLADIRTYFANQGVLEVETPILGQGIGTDINLEFFSTSYSIPPGGQSLFLQTSPEFSMKRLLMLPLLTSDACRPAASRRIIDAIPRAAGAPRLRGPPSTRKPRSVRPRCCPGAHPNSRPDSGFRRS